MTQTNTKQKGSEKKLDYKKMVEDINNLVETDFAEDMSMRANITHSGKHQEIKQEDAREMASLLARVYLISHCVHCESCGAKYRKDL